MVDFRNKFRLERIEFKGNAREKELKHTHTAGDGGSPIDVIILFFPLFSDFNSLNKSH